MRKSAAVAVVAVMLCGCTATPEPLPTPESVTSSSPHDSPLPTPVEVATDGAINEDTNETVTAEPVPTWDQAASDAAAEAAVTALRAFAHPELPHEQWWAQLQPYLTQEAAETYVHTDPSNVPVREVTGNPTLVESSSAYLALVDIDTDVGTYQVLVVRADGTAPWLVAEFSPPPDLGP